jgi:glycosyltransferase involved in cell wall biosynthesis
MRIAQVAPLSESVPPRNYGGTERVVSYLTEELVRQGHEVTLFASGDSVTSAELVPGCPRALRTDPKCVSSVPHQIVQLEQLWRRAGDFDVVHFHGDGLHLPFSRRAGVPYVTTLHGRLDIPDLVPLYREFDEAPLISISDSQRAPLAWANWVATIHHGLPTDLYSFHPSHRGYLAFVGRVSPEKRVDRAIEISRRSGIPLRIAAKVDRADRDYFKERIEPLLSTPGVEFIGEIGDEEKNEFLGNALAVVFPIDWPEPFGLVMIESMACGTPVIAFPCGSVPDVIEEGVSGFIVNDLDAAVRACERLGSVSRARCRAAFERRFAVSRMAEKYVRAFEAVIEAAQARPGENRQTPRRPRRSAVERKRLLRLRTAAGGLRQAYARVWAACVRADASTPVK